MHVFDHIAIIYNPNSTGDSPQMAKNLAKQIKDNLDVIETAATLTPTKHMGHAIELARDIALEHKRPLIISVSGDGGYNEVVNGTMQAKETTKKARPVVAVVGAGNANDHRRVMRDRPLIELIKAGKPREFDLIHLDARTKDFKTQRYAHSYIGFGITPEVGNELNKSQKNLLSEIRMILHTYRKYAPFHIAQDGDKRLLDNLVFANINEMAKIIKLDEKNTVHDDKFEVIELAHRSKLHMLGTLIKAAVVGFKNPPSYSAYAFETLDALPVQCDGEIEKLPAGSQVTITSRHAAIESLF